MRKLKFYIVLMTLLGYSITSLSQDDDYNWSEQTVYGLDEYGNRIIVNQSKSYADDFGRLLQSQVKSNFHNEIFATQPIYDALGRAAISTLPAPINQSTFGYKSNFVQDASGNIYGTDDFDGGKLNSPNPVGDQPGTLGWYYSASNTDEPMIGTTAYPYARSYTPATPDPRTSKSAGVGEKFRMGAGHDVSSSRQLIATGELSHYYDIRAHFISTPVDSENRVYKITTTDQEGNDSHVYVDADGHTLVSEYQDSRSYAFYNDLGQLVASVKPLGVDVSSTAFPSGHFSTYHYDHRGFLMRVEDEAYGDTEYMYSSDGKLRFSRNTEQNYRASYIFSYTHYDRSGRLIESGENHNALSMYSSELEALLDTPGHLWPEAEIRDWTKIYYDLEQPDFPSDPNHTDQGFTYGAVTATENEQTKTWYSYNEFGRVQFVKQLIKDLAKYITIDYEYNYLGQVTRVAYQKDIPGEAFFHHYSYTSNQQLYQVFTSVDGVEANKYLQATYTYYKHGSLKRVELATDLQGTDYTYTAQGALKSINHPDHTNDPGGDGSNGFVQDVFGLTLEYYEGDYTPANGNFSSLNLDDSEVHQKYNGNIRAVNYAEETLGLEHAYDDHLVLEEYDETNVDLTARKSITFKPGFNSIGGTLDAQVDPLGTYQRPDEPAKMYAYKYDEKEQLQTAIYDEQSGFNYNSEQNRVGEIVYDEHGNIIDLQRKDDNSAPLHDFDYVYDPGTDILHEITGYASYGYDIIGRVTSVDYVGTNEDAYIEYDAYDHVTAIYSAPAKTAADLRLSFKYNDQGYRLMKKNHDLDLETWYIRDVAGNLVSLYYRYGGQIYQGELPIYGASRLGIAYRNTSHYKYNYELTDHLGSVRAVITKLKFMETASMEPEVAILEESAFDHIADSRRQDAIFNHTPDSHVPGASHVAWLNGALGRVMGPAKSLKVSAGDVVSMEVYANYVDPNPTNDLVSGLALAVAGGYNFAGDGETATYFNALTDALAGPAAIGASPVAGAPKAYMQYLLFDNNFNYVSSIPVNDTYVMVTDNAMVTEGAGGQLNIPHEHLQNEITIPQDGYLFVYLVNETVNDVNVYFDDFTIMHLGVDILQTAEYYPMGLTFNEWAKGNEKHRFGYQGQFAEMDEETGWNNFELRMYDPVIGRWLSTDPYGQFASPYVGMGNNPGAVDPDGGLSAVATGALIGAGLGTGIGLAVDSDNWWKYSLGGAALGAAGGAIYNASTFDIPGIGRIGKGGGGVQRAAQATFSLPDVSNSIAVMNGVIARLRSSLPSGVITPELNRPLHAPRPTGRSYIVFQGEQSPDRYRVDGYLGWIDMMDDGSSSVRETWAARSGSRYLFATPQGDWTLSNFRWRNEEGFSRDGVGFSVDVGPDGRFGRMYLRIHPDGGPPGTAGCIGLTCGADPARNFANQMDNYLRTHGTMTLRVVDYGYTGIGGVTIRP